MSKKDRNDPKIDTTLVKATQSLSNPNSLVNQFLLENNLRMKVAAIDPSENGFIQTGFIIENRPILKVEFEYISHGS